MQELIGRLTPLDAEATETLKVVTYFDALMSAGLGLDAIVRAAASLTGTAAGARSAGRFARSDAHGSRLPDSDLPPDRLTVATQDGEVWIEREGPAHSNDAMVLERLALTVAYAQRQGPQSKAALAIAIDPHRAANEREGALSRLGLRPASQVRVVVGPAAFLASHASATTVPTANGLVSVTVLPDGADPDIPTPRGVGIAVRADEMWESLHSARLAYRLTDEETPVVDASELGVLLPAVDALLARQPEHADVLALARLDARTRHVLACIVTSDSIRSAAGLLHMHHSSVQARHEWLTERLGYDPRSAQGRARYEIATLAFKLGAVATR
ncbi:hypothetical protein [Streptomyces tsukubensis]|uniref:PucR C-terminal helix-turn-helix domain-containing protein n=1 Tax=Streptomyces tsukubensis TaxID=83656 RepID=A0A1V4A0R0_9ACTN|nr:hypothetical protein [Streptomyces tsukubensis]OON72406.1 hypothetical protein B1H18_29660 [Streptomyces tsukubensis]QFR96935.1 hypothetical protein GBW32_32685 [Streptomyces tsukubensis]